jgi:DNA-binding NarL/FixJ family response regulator
MSADADLVTKVAIVADSATLQEYLTELLRAAPKHNCVCICASAEEASAKIPGIGPNVALMDLQLPGKSGIVCTARLREDLPEVQIIMLTVYKDIKTIFQALKAGACGYVLKCAEERKILAAIAEVRAGGAPMTSEIARMVARSFVGPPPAPPGRNSRLSLREIEILVLLAEGLSNNEIGDQLNASLSTVRAHLMHIYDKLHFRFRGEAAHNFNHQSSIAH